ncbi:uncharacterized protein TRIADDRAFT_24020 [Trichoplax adhaerens]|uniref:SUMO-activating enzyme subunit n=1 Tax=Trichoplax adhaerens TaxID=10228 RepID=B3RVP5_TRIAD|nr:hypothetical protein TRIADDRAFT_24020 [Trichoplax adhaerens]EDV26032.1 hypothetical protein TRIADDRAFT_24020 [Trichoplax adhaerens]|eukprot:XP_002112065.1 hypothetical protein TRIADDRAFT_24020 [Trichoplax adhaerens]
MLTQLRKQLFECRVLVVGAGGIGCELIKNLVMTGFHNIELVDLDTIDVSNLNRQFLFRKEHVGQSKAKVAKENALRFNPDVNILARHDSIINPDYDVDYFRQFTIVLNALDNRAARNHVNRMCLAADVPLIESGSAGYLGQVTVIKKANFLYNNYGETECYECQPKPTQKSYPSCTIRNTPTEPIHCIVWAKHLFNQLFAELDEDNEVTPDAEDPEATDANKQIDQGSDSNLKISTRPWAESVGYDPQLLLRKLFQDDIKYLLKMDKLWQKRKPPVPLDFDNLLEGDSCFINDNTVLKDQLVWNIHECVQEFLHSVTSLKKRLEMSKSYLIWDKDDDVAMHFVASSANVRAHVFGIPLKSLFDVKSMAGNIIPAIATTNAIVAGLIVTEALKILKGRLDLCRTVIMYKNNLTMKKLIIPCLLEKPNKGCYVCSSKPEVCIRINIDDITIRHLGEEILKKRIGMIAPDVEVDDGSGIILISSEEGETEDIINCKLSQFGIRNGSQLKADDFLQNYSLKLKVIHEYVLMPPRLLFISSSKLTIVKSIIFTAIL